MTHHMECLQITSHYTPSFTKYINYSSLFLTIIKEMYETKDHSFHEIQGLTSRHLTNSMPGENILTSELPIKKQRAEKTKHMWIHVKSQGISAAGDYKIKKCL